MEQRALAQQRQMASRPQLPNYLMVRETDLLDRRYTVSILSGDYCNLVKGLPIPVI